MGEFMETLLSVLVHGLIGAFIGTLATLAGVRFNYHNLFARTVSENRMDWINKFRDEISTIVAAMKMKSGNDTVGADKLSQTKTDNVLFQAEKARASLITRLNQDITKPGNEYNRRMRDMLDAIEFGKSNDDTDELLDLSQKILEPEWKRVKEEAQGHGHV